MFGNPFGPSPALGGVQTPPQTTINVQADTVVYGETTTADDTPTILTLDGLPPAGANEMVLVDDSSLLFKGRIAAKQAGSLNTAAWEVEGLVVRGTGPASVSIVDATIRPVINIPGWDVAVVPNLVNGGFEVVFTGSLGATIKAIMELETIEVQS